MLEAIESTGRQTMTELRSILGVLRTDAEPDGGPTIAPALAGNLEHLGGFDDLPVELTIDGDVATLPDSVSVTGFRLIQEALTNIRRHAGVVEEVVVTLRSPPTP